MARYAKQEPHKAPKLTILSTKRTPKITSTTLPQPQTQKKVVLEQLTAAIAALTIKNEALFATNAKLAAEVTNLTRKLGQNAKRETSGTTTDKRSPRNCKSYKK